MQNAYYFEIYATRREPIHFEATEGSNAVPLMFRIMDWDIPPASTTNIYFEKPSGLLIYNAGSIEGNLLTFDMTTQMTAEVGVVDGQIEVIQGTTIMYSFPFQMKVIKSIIDDAAIESTNEFTTLEEALAQVQDALPTTNVAGKGSASVPVYFDNSGVASAITALDITHGGTGANSASGALTALGAVPLTNVASKGTSGLPVYFNASGVATAITKADLQTTLDIDDIQGDITTIQTALTNIAGGKKIAVGHQGLSYSSATEMKATVTTGLTSVDYALACPCHTTAGTNYPTGSSNSTPLVYVRKNYDSDGKITISAYGSGFVSGHGFPVDWLAIGT